MSLWSTVNTECDGRLQYTKDCPELMNTYEKNDEYKQSMMKALSKS